MKSSPQAIRSRRFCRSISPRAGNDDYGNVAGAVRAQLGRLDALVHTATMLGSLGPIEHQSFDAWLKVLRVNLAAAMAMTRAMLPLLAAAADASVVFTLDTRGQAPRAYWGAYAVAKAGLAALATILADEWENRPDAARQCRRPGADQLAVARPDASGRRARLRSPIPRRSYRFTCICSAHSRRQKAGC